MKQVVETLPINEFTSIDDAVHEDFIGVEYEDGTRGFVQALTGVTYCVTRIQSLRSQLTRVTYSTVEKLLRINLVLNANIYIFNDGVELGKWLYEEFKQY